MVRTPSLSLSLSAMRTLNWTTYVIFLPCRQNPVNVQLQTTTVRGWPRIVFVIHERDGLLGTDSICAYGLSSIPMSPGYHHSLECCTWTPGSPNSSLQEDFRELMTGTSQSLADLNTVWNRSPAVLNLQSTGYGKVFMQFNIVFKVKQSSSHLLFL